MSGKFEWIMFVVGAVAAPALYRLSLTRKDWLVIPTIVFTLWAVFAYGRFSR